MAVDMNGKSFPVTFSLNGFKNSENPTLTTQWATAYEFQGNAEGVNGQVAAWRK